MIIRYCLLFLAFTSMSGCGGPKSNYDLVDLVSAHGTITLDGSPLASAVVTFEDVSDDTLSFAMTDSKGHYRLQFDSEMSGVKVGEKIVRISTTRKILGLNARPGGENDSEAQPTNSTHERVPVEYNKKSELKVNVTKARDIYDFDLASQ